MTQAALLVWLISQNAYGCALGCLLHKAVPDDGMPISVPNEGRVAGIDVENDEDPRHLGSVILVRRAIVAMMNDALLGCQEEEEP